MEQQRNYYTQEQSTVSGLKYRWDGRDVIKSVAEQLKGSVKDERGRHKEYDPQMRMMNDVGVYRATFFMQGIITKINHLTKYSNEERVLKQIRELSKMWAFELALHRRKWDVKDKDLVQQVVENAIYQSALRSVEGFEAELSSKGYNVEEIIDHRQKNQRQGFLSGFGRGNNGFGGGN